MIGFIKSKTHQLQQFLTTGVWEMDLARMPLLERLYYSVIRGVAIVFRGFIEDKCALQASALTFITLMATVPTMALFFAVAKGMGFEQHLKRLLQKHTGGAPAPATDSAVAAATELPVADTTVPAETDAATSAPPPTAEIDAATAEAPSGLLDAALEQSLESGNSVQIPKEVGKFVNEILDMVSAMDLMALGIVGLLLTVFSVVRVLGKIESTFNIIWGIQTGRTWVRRLADFSLVLIVVPLMFMVVTAINALLSSDRIIGWIESKFGVAAGLYQSLLGTTGIVMVVLAFALLYLCLPNTRVKISSALIGGLCSGLLWLGWQWACIRFQIGITNMSAIYGAFSGLPISLFWLQINWIIVLLGAEISFAFQNVNTYVHESHLRDLTFATRVRLAHYIVHEVCHNYREGTAPWQPQDFQTEYNVPIRLLRAVIHDLTQHGVLLEVEGGGLIPGKDTSVLSLRDVELALYGSCSRYIERLSERIEAPSLAARLKQENDFLTALDQETLADVLAEEEKTLTRE